MRYHSQQVEVFFAGMSSSLLVIPSTSGSSLRNIDAEGRWVENEFTRRRWTAEQKAKVKLAMMNIQYMRFLEKTIRCTVERKEQAVRKAARAWGRISKRLLAAEIQHVTMLMISRYRYLEYIFMVFDAFLVALRSGSRIVELNPVGLRWGKLY